MSDSCTEILRWANTWVGRRLFPNLQVSRNGSKRRFTIYTTQAKRNLRTWLLRHQMPQRLKINNYSPAHRVSYCSVAELSPIGGKKNKVLKWRCRLATSCSFSSRGDRTAIELFIADVRGWEVGVRRRMDDGKPKAD